jgi:hypothetical protein
VDDPAQPKSDDLSPTARSRDQPDDGPAQASVATPAAKKRGPQHQVVPLETWMASRKRLQLKELPHPTGPTSWMVSSAGPHGQHTEEQQAGCQSTSKSARACLKPHSFTLAPAGFSLRTGHLPRSSPAEVQPVSQRSACWKTPVAVQWPWPPQWAVNDAAEQISRGSVHPETLPCFPWPMGHQQLVSVLPVLRSVPSSQSGGAMVFSILTPLKRSMVSLLFPLSCLTLCGSSPFQHSSKRISERERTREREGSAERVRASLLSLLVEPGDRMAPYLSSQRFHPVAPLSILELTGFVLGLSVRTVFSFCSGTAAVSSSTSLSEAIFPPGSRPFPARERERE